MRFAASLTTRLKAPANDFLSTGSSFLVSPSAKFQRKVRDLYHIFAPAHVVYPFLFLDYYPEQKSWLSSLNKSHLSHFLEMRTEQGTVSQTLQLDPKKIHIHPELDIALCRLASLPSSFSLKPLQLSNKKLIPTEIVFMFGHTAELIPVQKETGPDIEDALMRPDTLKGTVNFHYKDKYYLLTKTLPSQGMCGGPTILEEDVVGMLEGYVKSEGILKGQSCVISSQLLQDFQNAVEEQVLSDLEE